MVAPDDDEEPLGEPAAREQLPAIRDRDHIISLGMEDERPGLIVLAVPHFFHAGQSSTTAAPSEWIFMATAPPRDEPTTTSGRCLSNSACAIRPASVKSSSGRAGLNTNCPCTARYVGLTPPGTEFQPCRNNIVAKAFTVCRFVTHRIRQILHVVASAFQRDGMSRSGFRA